MGYFTIVQLLCCLTILQQGNTLPAIASLTYSHIVSNLSSDHLLTVHGGYGDPGTVIDIYERSQDPFWINTNQLWRKEIQSDGTLKVVSKLGDNVQLTIEDGRAVTSSSGTIFMERSVDGASKLIIADEVKVLTVPGGAADNSPLAPAALETSNNDDSQKWRFEVAGTGYGVIHSTDLDLVMTVHGGHGNPGTVIDIYRRTPYVSYNQLWRREYLGDGTFKLISKLGNHVQLTIKAGKVITSLHGTHLKEKAEGDGLVRLVAEEALTVPGGVVNNSPVVASDLQDASNDANQKWFFSEG